MVGATVVVVASVVDVVLEVVVAAVVLVVVLVLVVDVEVSVATAIAGSSSSINAPMPASPSVPATTQAVTCAHIGHPRNDSHAARMPSPVGGHPSDMSYAAAAR